MKLIATTAVLCSILFATVGQSAEEAEEQPRVPVHPLSNPVYFDTAQPKTQVTAIYAYHMLPDKISTIAGKVPLGGEVHVIAVQIEWALNEEFSLVANKTGFVIFDPDNTLENHNGFGDISAGLKWAFHRDEDLTVAARATIEFPTGSGDVLQGNGNGNISPALLATWLCERGQLAGVLGLVAPFDTSEESWTSYLSVGGAYKVLDKLAVLLELNWFRVIDEGNGRSHFGGQLGRTVPAIVQFEGADYFNLGAANADDHPDLVTLAFGASFQAMERLEISAGYELPLTDEKNGLYDGRVYVKSAIRF